MPTTESLRAAALAALGLALGACAQGPAAAADPAPPTPAPAPAPPTPQPLPLPVPTPIFTPPAPSCSYAHACRGGGPADPVACAIVPDGRLGVAPTDVVVNEEPGAPREPHLDVEFTKEARKKANFSEACCYTWTLGCMGGRPALDRGRPVLAPTRAKSGWAGPLRLRPLPDGLRRQLGEGWLEAARAEHSSVAAFAGLTLDLLAFGAPAELVAAALEAGREEIGHAEACFGVASALLGVELGPGPLPLTRWKRAESLQDLAVAAFREGCVGESVAALVAERAADRAVDPAIAAIQRKIAREEAGHATLAWRIVRWATAAAPADLATALDGLEPACEPDFPAGHGLPTAGDLARARADVVREIASPIAALLCA